MGYTTEQAKNMLPSYIEIEFHKMYKGNSVEDFFFFFNQMVPKQLKSHSQKKKKKIHPLHYIQKLTTSGSVFN